MTMTPSEQAALQALADTHTAYASDPNWPQNRPSIVNVGAFLVDRCVEAGPEGAAAMKGILQLISHGLVQPDRESKDYKNAVKAAQMFQALYTNNATIKSNMQNGLHQIDSLSAGKLAASLEGNSARPDALQTILAGTRFIQENPSRPPRKLGSS